ncbi:MAG: GntR family transcriptional regulator [Planctomycetota bacterium]
MQDACPRATDSTHVQFSYKFQRLREQLRSAVTGGEYAGRLPGERELGKRFGANAKTINKALCDLASDGLVVRHIGRGTYVVQSDGMACDSVATNKYRAMIGTGAEATSSMTGLLDEIRTTLAGVGKMLDCTPTPTLGPRQTLLGQWPVAWRRETGGVFVVPTDPLESHAGRLDEASMAEMLRRQMPMVVVGALSGGMKSCAVAPDYSDAGFRLCEHLAQAGCDEVVVAISTETREAQIVAAGAMAAAKRYAVTCRSIVGGIPTNGNGNGHGGDHLRGVICVGAGMLSRVMQDAGLRRKAAEGEMLFAAMLAPGDESAKSAGIAWYDVSRKTVAEWAARLMLDAKPGQRPVEVIIPGAVRTVAAHESAGGNGYGPVCGTSSRIASEGLVEIAH